MCSNEDSSQPKTNKSTVQNILACLAEGPQRSRGLGRVRGSMVPWLGSQASHHVAHALPLGAQRDTWDMREPRQAASHCSGAEVNANQQELDKPLFQRVGKALNLQDSPVSCAGQCVCAAPRPSGLSVNISPSRMLVLPEPVSSAACAPACSVASFVSDSLGLHGLCSPTGSSVHGISQAKILEWVASSFSKASFEPRDQTCACYVSFMDRHVLYH